MGGVAEGGGGRVRIIAERGKLKVRATLPADLEDLESTKSGRARVRQKVRGGSRRDNNVKSVSRGNMEKLLTVEILHKLGDKSTIPQQHGRRRF